MESIPDVTVQAYRPPDPAESLFMNVPFLQHINVTSLGDVTYQFNGFELTAPKLEPHTFYATYVAGEWDSIRLRRGDTVLDAGANVGDFTIRAARAVGPKGSVVAIEPSKSALQYLELNVARNKLENVRIVHGYLTSHAGSQWFSERGTYATPIENPVPERNSYRVRGYTLAELTTEVDTPCFNAIKMDIEGGEEDVFLDSTLLDGVRAIGVETHGSKADDLVVKALRARYTCVESYDVTRLLKAVVKSVLWSPFGLVYAECLSGGTATRALMQAALRKHPIPSLAIGSEIAIRYGHDGTTHSESHSTSISS